MAEIVNSSSNDPLITAPTRYTGLHARHLRAAVAAGRLPPPVQLGRKLRAWRKSALDALLSGQATPALPPFEAGT